MTDLNQTILQKASGENRFNPDEQRLYMGTFRERVLLTMSFDEAASSNVQSQFSDICQKLQANYPALFLKLSPKLSQNLQMDYLKTAKNLSITTSIIEEDKASSPYALLFHTDYAVDLEDASLETQFPNIKTKKDNQTETKKTVFWQKLFGG
ncbi:DUF1694 domain-containing protein [Streptococcus cameli]